MHCQNFMTPAVSRRDMLSQCANGFGAVAAAALLLDPRFGGGMVSAGEDSSATPAAIPGIGPGTTPVELPANLSARPAHFSPRARNVIFLFMDGGPSQVDTFDPKPLLDKEHGNRIRLAEVPATQFDNVGTVLRSPWKFRNYGECGLPVSDLFPNVAQHADKLAVIRSMTSEFSEHTSANYFVHSGSGIQGRPSMGAWITYGLGNESQNLPGFVVLNQGMIPPGGLDCFTSGFLSASFQGSLFAGRDVPVADVTPLEKQPGEQTRKLNLLRALDRRVAERTGRPDSIEAAIANYELAFRMQTAVPELTSLDSESLATQQMYGIDDPVTTAFGRECLLARRLIERGVRFVEVLCPSVGHDRWDQHSNLIAGHNDNARAVDKPIAGLLADLEARGLLDETLVVWAGEFGRTPMAQGSDGRDHNPYGFSLWLAGGGVRGGCTFGATDEWGYFAVEDRLQMHDLHATMLHLLGLNHKRLTYRFGGRDMRLTDVHGHVIDKILA